MRGHAGHEREREHEERAAHHQGRNGGPERALRRQCPQADAVQVSRQRLGQGWYRRAD
jgi:hypothetical protein